jgi:hypothetical protein
MVQISECRDKSLCSTSEDLVLRFEALGDERVRKQKGMDKSQS